MASVTFDIEFNPQREKIDKFINSLKKALKSLGVNVGGLNDFVSDLSSVDKGAKKASDQLDKMGKKAKGIAKVGGVLGKAFTFNQISQSLTMATQSLSAFTQPFVDLDTQVRNIGTLGVKNFQEFTDLSLQLSKTVPKSSADIAGATYQAISAGIQGTNAEIIKFVEQSAKVATAGLATTEASVNGLTSVINAYKLNTGDAEKVSDTFFAAIKLGKTSFNDLNGALANMIPAGSSAGIQFDELAASIAQMTSLGVPTSQASTQIRAAIIELQKPGKGLADVMKSAGLSIENIGDTLKNQGLIATLQQIQEAGAKTGKSMTQIFSSSEAASAGLLLTGTNAETATAKLKGVREEIEAGASTEAYNVAADSIANKTQIVVNKIQAFFGGIFDTLGSGALTAVNTLNQVGPALAGLGGLGAIIPTGLFGKIKQLGISILTFIVPSLGTASAASVVAAFSFKAMWTALTGPVGLVIAGIIAITAALAWFFTSTESGKGAWAGLKETFLNIWDSMLKKLKSVWNYFKPVFTSLGNLFAELGGIAKILGELLFNMLITPFQILWSVIEIGWKILKYLVTSFFDLLGVSADTGDIMELLSSAIDKIVTGFKNMRYLTAGIVSVFSSIRSVFTDLVKAFQENSLLDAVKKSMSIFSSIGDRAKKGFIDGVRNAQFEDVVDAVFEPLNKQIDKVAKETSDIIENELNATKPNFNDIISSLKNSQTEQLIAINSHKEKELARHNITEKQKLILTERYAKLENQIKENSANEIAEYQEKLNDNSDSNITATNQAKTFANLSKQKKADALIIIKEKKEELAYELDIFKINQEIIRVEENRDKTAKDELIEQSKKVDNLIAYQDELNKALNLGYVLQKNGTQIKIDKSKFNEEVQKLNKEIDIESKNIELLSVRIGIDSQALAKELKDVERENLKLDIQLGFKSDSDLLEAVKNDKKALEEELKNIKLSPIDRDKINIELKKLTIDIIDMQADLDLQIAESRIRGIQAASQREYEYKKLDLNKWLNTELNAFRNNEKAKEQIKKEYQRKKNALEAENIRKSTSLMGEALRVSESIFEAFNKPFDNSRAEGIQEEIDLLKEKENNELDALKSGEISYNEYVARLNDIDQERLDKTKELQSETRGIWDTFNEGIAAGMEASLQLSTKNMAETWAEFGALFDTESGRRLSKNGEDVKKLEKIGEQSLVKAGQQFVQLLAKGDNVLRAAKKAILGTIVDTVMQGVQANIPLIISTASGLLGPIAGPIAAGALIATVLALASKAKATISRYSGGEMLGTNAKGGGVVRKRQLYEVGEFGKEFIFDTSTYQKNEEYVHRMHAGESFEDIVNRDFIPRAIAAERILQEKKQVSMQHQFNKQIALQNKNSDKMINEIKKLQRTFRHNSMTEVEGEFKILGNDLVTVLENANRGYIE